MMNFWKNFPGGFLALAPMEDVTDTVFRQIVVSVARPNVMFTEFVNVEGLCHWMSSRPQRSGVEGSLDFARDDKQNPVLQRLVFAEIERPIVAQIWGTDPDKFCEAAKHAKKLGFDGVDINFGCPDRKVMKIGAGAAQISNNQDTRNKVKNIIEATKTGAEDLPVSVKTRIGIKTIVTEEWLGFLLEQDLAAITVHGRTAAEMSLVSAHWDEIGKVVKLRDKMNLPTKIIGNGDVESMDNAKLKIDNYGVDGVMVGRGIFKNVAVFSAKGEVLSPKDKSNLLINHLILWEKTWGGNKNFAVMKKFVKMYISGWDGAGMLRAKLMEAQNALEMMNMLNV